MQFYRKVLIISCQNFLRILKLVLTKLIFGCRIQYVKCVIGVFPLEKRFWKKDVTDVKKKYTTPEMTIEEIEIEDVITRSGPGRPGADDDDEELLP